MKRILTTLLFSLVFFGLCAQKADLPNVTIENLDGEPVSIAKLYNDGKPFIIVFWTSWCDPDILQLNAWAKVYQKWVDNTGVKVFAICIEDSRYTKKIKPFVENKGWPFEFYNDPEKVLYKRMVGSSPIGVPFVFLFDGEGKVVWSTSGHKEGDEELVYQEIIKCISHHNTTDILDLPNVTGADNSTIDLYKLNDGKPFIISFIPDYKNFIYLDELKKVYDKWEKETGVKIYLITYLYNDYSKDKTNTLISSYKDKQMPFDLFVCDEDYYSLIRKENAITGYPYTFIFDGNKKMVCQYPGYWEGMVESIYKNLLKLVQ